MNDKAFLLWIHDRLIFEHGENKNFDYMHKLRAIIKDIPEDKYTSNICSTYKEDDSVNITHEGGLYIFGESTIEVEYIGDPGKPPFERVNKGDK